MKAPNTRVLARIDCPRCGRPEVAVRTDYSIYSHQGADESCLPCLGTDPEVVFTVLLRMHGLDARLDSGEWDLPVGSEWQRRQRRSDAEARAYYSQFNRRAEA